MNFVELYISDACPLTCKHCFHGDVRSVDAALSYSEWINVIEQCRQMGINHFHIAGREPFTESITLQIIQYLSIMKEKDPKVKFGTITNGLNFRKYIHDVSLTNIDYIEFSVDGLEAQHDYMRGKGTYKVLTNIISQSNLLLGSSRLNLSTALTQSNSTDMLELVKVFSKIGIRKFFFQPLYVGGYATNIAFEKTSIVQYQDMILNMLDFLKTDYAQSIGISVMFHIPPDMSQVLTQLVFLKTDKMDFVKQNNGIITVRVGNNRLQIDYKIKHIPFQNSFIITHDGYIIDQFIVRARQDYIKQSIGNVKQKSLFDFFQ